MQQYKGYLIDLDGTMYNGTKPIESAVAFVKQLQRKGIPFLYVTNNSSSTPEAVANKLEKMGAPAAKEQVITSGQATAGFIQTRSPEATCYMIGETGLKQALEEKGLKMIESMEMDGPADYMIVGIDRHITYEKYTQACLQVRAGATFISTNGDISIPTERGMLPGNGALTSVVAVSTGVRPTYIGKPESAIMQEALKKINLPREQVVMIGDNFDTDILAGINARMDTIMVLTGVSPASAVTGSPVKPTHMIDNLSEWSLSG